MSGRNESSHIYNFFPLRFLISKLTQASDITGATLIDNQINIFSFFCQAFKSVLTFNFGLKTMQ